tara:strand:- start:97 stop:357 length:261 start_codon:yes stop_codon:yes gene_type:complete
MSREKYFTDFLLRGDTFSVVEPRFSKVYTAALIFKIIKRFSIITRMCKAFINFQRAIIDNISGYKFVHVIESPAGERPPETHYRLS